MTLHRLCATLLDHDDIIYSSSLFAVHCDLEQSASGLQQLPLPPCAARRGIEGKQIRRERERERERESKRERERESERESER